MRLAIASLALLGATLVSVAQVAQRSPQDQTTSNMKQCAVAVAIYMSDYEDHYPAAKDIEALKKVTYPYTKNLAIWKSSNPNSPNFEFNKNLSGVDSNNVPEPAKLALIYDSKPWPDGSRVVAYSDTHVGTVASKAWPAVEALMKQKIKKSRGAQ